MSGSAAHRGSEAVRATYSGQAPTDVSLRKYLVERDRSGVNAASEYQVADNTRVFLRGTLATYEVLEKRQTLRYRQSPGALERELQDLGTRRTIAMASAGGQRLLRRGAGIDYRLSVGYGHLAEPRNVIINFARRMQVDLPPVMLTSAHSAGAQDASTFKFSSLIADTLFSRDRDVGGAVNFTMPVGVRAGSLLTAGVKYRSTIKTRDVSGASGQLEPGEPSTLADFAGCCDAFVSPIGPPIDPVIASRLADNVSLVADAGTSAAKYRAHENLFAAYVMVELPLSPRLTVIPGVRHEYSTSRYQGHGFDGMTTWPLASKGRDGQWLPGVNARYAVDDNTIVRAALTRSLARPDFADLVPYDFRVDDVVTRGNPLLKPTRSWNADLAVERYFAPSGLMSVALFTKKLDHYIYTFETTATLNGRPISLTQPGNGEAATITGIELTFQQQLRMLPAPFNSLGLYATYTRTMSKGTYPTRPGSVTALPGQTPHLGNVALSYERGGFSSRLAVNFHSAYLDRIRLLQVNDDHFAGRTQVDTSITQHVGRRTWLVFDADNLTDARNTTFRTSISRPTSIERYGRYMTFGVRLAF